MGLLTKYHSKEWDFSKGYAKQKFWCKEVKWFYPNDPVPKTEGKWRKRDCDCIFSRVSRKQYLVTISSGCPGKWIPVQRRKRQGQQIQITSNLTPKASLANSSMPKAERSSCERSAAGHCPQGLPEWANRNTRCQVKLAFQINNGCFLSMSCCSLIQV